MFRYRKRRFTSDEIKTLLNGVSKHKETVCSKMIYPNSARNKKKVWATIAEEVNNADSSTPNRSMSDVKKKWNDLKCVYNRYQNELKKHGVDSEGLSKLHEEYYDRPSGPPEPPVHYDLMTELMSYDPFTPVNSIHDLSNNGSIAGEIIESSATQIQHERTDPVTTQPSTTSTTFDQVTETLGESVVPFQSSSTSIPLASVLQAPIFSIQLTSSGLHSGIVSAQSAGPITNLDLDFISSKSKISTHSIPVESSRMHPLAAAKQSMNSSRSMDPRLMSVSPTIVTSQFHHPITQSSLNIIGQKYFSYIPPWKQFTK